MCWHGLSEQLSTVKLFSFNMHLLFYIQNERVFLLNAFSTVPFCGEIVHFWRIKQRSPKPLLQSSTTLPIQLSWCAVTSQNYLDQTHIWFLFLNSGDSRRAIFCLWLNLFPLYAQKKWNIFKSLELIPNLLRIFPLHLRLRKCLVSWSFKVRVKFSSVELTFGKSDGLAYKVFHEYLKT